VCQWEGRPFQGHVIVKDNPLVSKPIVGHVYLFFCVIPLNKGLCGAVSKWCISDHSMESIAKTCIHHFETAARVYYMRA
jgi:hypothetical protein